MRRITLTQIRRIAEFTQEFTDSAFRSSGIGGDLGHGARYSEGTSHKIWFGKSGGRTHYAAYMIGFALEWARLSGQEIPDDMRELMVEVECSFARRYEAAAMDTMFDGRAMAESRYLRRFTRTVTNSNEDSFLVRYVPVSAAGQPVLEFYDTAYDHTRFGQFTGGRYDLALMLSHPDGFGLDLYGGEPKWNVSAANMQEIKTWLRREFSDN